MSEFRKRAEVSYETAVFWSISSSFPQTRKLLRHLAGEQEFIPWIELPAEQKTGKKSISVLWSQRSPCTIVAKLIR
jgi:hypothetical protein